MFTGVRASLPHDVSLVGPHSPGRAQLWQLKGSERFVATHRAPRVLPGEHQPIGAGQEEEETSAKEGGAAGQKQHQSAMPVPACDQRGRGRSFALFLAADASTGAERAGEFIGGELLRQARRLQALIGSTQRDARFSPSPPEVILSRKKDPVNVACGRTDEIQRTRTRASRIAIESCRREANRWKATSWIPLEILLSSCSSSEVVVEGLRAKTRKRYIDEALKATKREGGYFSRGPLP